MHFGVVLIYFSRPLPTAFTIVQRQDTADSAVPDAVMSCLTERFDGERKEEAVEQRKESQPGLACGVRNDCRADPVRCECTGGTELVSSYFHWGSIGMSLPGAFIRYWRLCGIQM